MDLPNLSFLLIVVCFWLAFWVVNRQLVRPILRLLEEREQRVASAHATFTQAQNDMEEALARREKELVQVAAEAQKERARLRAEGERVRRQKLEEARAEGHKRLTEFQGELERELLNTREALRGQTHLLAQELAQRLLGRMVTS